MSHDVVAVRPERDRRGARFGRAATPRAASDRRGSASRGSPCTLHPASAAASASRWRVEPRARIDHDDVAAPVASPPTMYVPVPWYVNFDGFSAITRRTSGATGCDDRRR